MHLEELRAFCLSLPHTQEKMQWGDHILFTIGGKMFCISTVEPTNDTKMSFKCVPDVFVELVERDAVIPAPYMARNFWVSLEKWDALPATELKQLLRNSYQLVLEKLPKRVQQELGVSTATNADSPRNKAAPNTSLAKKKASPKSSAKKKVAGSNRRRQR
jgi:predicted DNA-binding protein (MmcQ/YjbR family)